MTDVNKAAFGECLENVGLDSLNCSIMMQKHLSHDTVFSNLCSALLFKNL